MSRHGYPLRILALDYFRATTGLILTVGPIMLAEPLEIIQYILGGVAVLFAAFGLRTLLRHFTRVEVGERGIRTEGPFPRAVEWRDMTEVDLRYYSTRRDRERGWMQLRIDAGAVRLAFDSTISNFAQLAESVLAAAERHGLALSAATLSNRAAVHGRQPS